MPNASSAHAGDAALNPTDEALFERYATSGCQDSFTELYNRYYPRLIGFIRKRVKDAAHAEDLAQDIFVRALGAADRFDPNRRFSSWIGTIASNVVKNSYRSHDRRRVIPEAHFNIHREDAEGTALSPVERASTQVTPDTVLQDTLLSEQLTQALDQLSDDYRTIFTLRHIEGYSIAEVADILGLPHGATKARSTRARRKMRDLMSHVLDDDTLSPD